MRIFVRTVEDGSLSAAARGLDLSPSAVSKRIRALEDRVGLRLLNRSTRHIALTDEGRVFLERCRQIVAAIEEAETMATAMAGRVSGTLRISATVAFAKARLLPILPEFLERYPGLELKLELTDRPIDLVGEGIDVAIRFSEQLDRDSVVARRLAPNERIVCAAPSYLRTNPPPATPEELYRHNCVRLSTVLRWNDWDFEDETGRRTIHVRGNFEANSADAVYRAVLAGVGVARLSTYLVADDLADGRLVHLLPQYAHADSHVHAVYADRRNLAPKVRCFVDFLIAKFGAAEPPRAPQATAA